MLFTRQNIINRTIAAKCCLADMTVEMMEAKSKGDEELYDCKADKAWVLNDAIEEMCYYVSNNVFGQNIGEENSFDAAVFEYEFRVSQGAAPDSVILESSKLGGIDIAPKNTQLSSSGATWRQVLERYANAINGYTQDYANGVHYARARVAMSADDITTNVYVHFDKNRLGDSPVIVETFADDAGPAHEGTDTQRSTTISEGISCFTNEQAKKLLNIMDEVCGCPCKCSDSKITDDTLPKYF